MINSGFEGDHSESVSTDSFSQLQIFGHNGDSLGVDGAEVGVFEEGHQVGLSWLLEGQDGLALEPDLLFELSGDLTDQSLEGQLPDQQVSLNKKKGRKEGPTAKVELEICHTLFWNFLIYLRATVPGLNLWGFLTPETMGADLRAIFWAASCLRGTFWAVDLRAVCLVRAISN